METLTLVPGKLDLPTLRRFYLQPQPVVLDKSAAGPIADSVRCVDEIVREGRTAYGINTGFGLLASTRIAAAERAVLSLPIAKQLAKLSKQPTEKKRSCIKN